MIETIKNLETINYFLNKLDSKITQKDIESNFHYYLGYIIEKEIVGLIGYSRLYEKVELDYLYVEENYRNQNIASKLVNKLLEDCKEQETENITLEVRESNQIAINFYQKFGFKTVAKREKYYKDEDGILMLKVIN